MPSTTSPRPTSSTPSSPHRRWCRPAPTEKWLQATWAPRSLIKSFWLHLMMSSRHFPAKSRCLCPFRAHLWPPGKFLYHISHRAGSNPVPSIKVFKMDRLFVSCSNEKFKHQHKNLIYYSLLNVKLNKQRTFRSPYWLLRSQENNMSPSLCQGSLGLCIFSKSSCCPSSWFCFCHYVSDLFLAVWGVLPPTHVSFKE